MVITTHLMLCRLRHPTLRWVRPTFELKRSSYFIRTFATSTSLCSDSPTEDSASWANRRLSRLWAPSGGITTGDEKHGDPTALLVQAGYIRQSQSGIFHYLPLAHRLEEVLRHKLVWHLETLLDAAQVSLSALSSEDLWRQSGRIAKEPLSIVQHQFLTVNDRKSSRLILSPTHEEEITTLVAHNAKSYHNFPLRLFQINRKYRDELRPRHGLLRTKEFIMKDLYTFDVDEVAAMQTYDNVRQVYRIFFRRLGLPIVEAKASSGDMGGSLSHEFHVLSELGEDTLHICQSCGFAENSEVSEHSADSPIEQHSCPQCSKKSMTARKAIEVGHTFHLGTRYSEPLNAFVEVPQELEAPQPGVQASQGMRKTKRVPLQMGCHGIGLSRLIGATASVFADSKGLRWPLHVHPISAIIIIDGPAENVPGLHNIYQALNSVTRNTMKHVMAFKAWLDDRNRSLAWKLKDAELVGYPIAVVLGRKWLETGEYEIKCRTNPELSTTSKDLCGSIVDILNGLDPDVQSSKKKAFFIPKPAYKHAQKAAEQHPLYMSQSSAPASSKTRPSGQRAQDLGGVRRVHVQEAKIPASSTRAMHTLEGLTSRKRQLEARPIRNKITDSWMPPSKPEGRKRKVVPRKMWPNITSKPAAPFDTPQPTESLVQAQATTLSREHLLEKVQLLERLFALQDLEQKDLSKKSK